MPWIGSGASCAATGPADDLPSPPARPPALRPRPRRRSGGGPGDPWGAEVVAAIDLFAGLGGWTCAAESAGVDVLWAANHWPLAVHYHGLNHPKVQHACQDLQQADFRDAPRHDLLLASPSCTGHTRARGKEAKGHDSARATAFAVVTAMECHRPAVALVENVREFLSWVLYPAWELAVQLLGYSVAPHILDAADHGVAQNRERLFLVCTRTKAPLRLTFAPQEKRTAEDLIGWDRGEWSPVRKPHRSPATIRQAEEGYRQGLSRFLLPYYGSARTGETPIIRRVDRPIGTLTTDDRYGIVQRPNMRMLSIQETREAMGFPASTLLPIDHKAAMKMLGNAIVPAVGRDLIRAVLEAA